MKKNKSTNLSTLLYVLSLVNVFYTYLKGDKTVSYILFMICLIIFSFLIVITSTYSLDAHKSALLSFIGSMNGASLLFMSAVLPISWFQWHILKLDIILLPSIFMRSFLPFLFLFCIASILVFYYFDKPLYRKRICYLYLFLASSVFTAYVILNTSFLPTNKIGTHLLFHYIVLGLVIYLMTLGIVGYLCYKKNIFKEKKNTLILILLVLLSSSILLTTAFSYFIPYLLYMTLQLTNIFLFFRITMSDSIIQYSRDLSRRLDLYTQNNKLMNAYLTHISSEQATMAKQYTYIDTLYSQMMFFYPNALFIIVDQHIYHINEHAKNLLKYNKLDTMMYTLFTDYIAPESKEAVQNVMHSLYKHTVEYDTIEAKFITATHVLIDVELYLTLSHADDPRAIIVSAKDISHKKQQAMLKQAIELEKVKVEFLCTISHELKTPVNIIYSATQLQNNFIQSEDYDKIPTYNSMVAQNCMRLLKLLNNFLDVNRLEGHHFSLSPRTLNIVALTESILESILPYTERKHITSIFDTVTEEIYCTVDCDLIERILLNLFSNAIKYGHQAGHIWVNLTLETDYVCIHIKDDGVGIPQESQKLIFKRFSRVENGLIRKAEGAGIGLSLVKSFVELNKGTIHVESTVGLGTEFIIRLPIETDPNLLDQLDSNYTAHSDKVNIEFSDLYMD